MVYSTGITSYGSDAGVCCRIVYIHGSVAMMLNFVCFLLPGRLFAMHVCVLWAGTSNTSGLLVSGHRQRDCCVHDDNCVVVELIHGVRCCGLLMR